MKIVPKEEGEEELKWRGPCISLEVNAMEDLSAQDGNCLTFSDETAKKFWADGRIRHEVHID